MTFMPYDIHAPKAKPGGLAWSLWAVLLSRADFYKCKCRLAPWSLSASQVASRPAPLPA